MALNFPANPTLDQVYTSGNRSWVWNGTAWIGDPNGFNYTADRVLLGNGANPFQEIAPGPAGYVLQSNGTTWQSQPFPGPPGAPANVVATASATAGRIDVSWDASTTATVYTVYYGTTNPVTTTNALGSVVVTIVSASITGLTGGTAYYIAVTASNGYGTSVLSSQVTQTPNGVPTAPTLVSATGSSATELLVTWTAGGGKPTPTSHRLYYSTTSPVTVASTSVVITSSPHTLTGLTAGTTYYVAVGAVNSYGTTLSGQSSAGTWPAGTTTWTPGQTFTISYATNRTFNVASNVTKIRINCVGGGGGGGGYWNSPGTYGGNGGYANAEIPMSSVLAAEGRLFTAFTGGGGGLTYQSEAYKSSGQGGGGSFLVGYNTGTVYVAAGGGGGAGSGWNANPGYGGNGGVAQNNTGFFAGANGQTGSYGAAIGGTGGGATPGTAPFTQGNASGRLGGPGGDLGTAGNANNSTYGAGGSAVVASNQYASGGGGGGGYFGGGGGGWASAGAGGGGGGSYVNPTYCTAYSGSTNTTSGGAGGTVYGEVGTPGGNGSVTITFI
jgi:hypothetical protein